MQPIHQLVLLGNYFFSKSCRVFFFFFFPSPAWSTHNAIMSAVSQVESRKYPSSSTIRCIIRTSIWNRVVRLRNPFHYTIYLLEQDVILIKFASKNVLVGVGPTNTAKFDNNEITSSEI